MRLTDKHREYWRKNLRLTGALLGIWFLVTYVVIFFARELEGIVIAGFPLPFYMGAQGAPIIYLLIIGYYARRMNRIDLKYDVAEEEN